METLPRSFLHILLTICIGLFVAGVVGFGIAAFYPAPKAPVSEPYVATPASTPSAEQLKRQNDDYTAWSAQTKTYNRNVAAVAVVAAVILLVVSLTVLKDLVIINDGMLLGGIFTLVYSVMRALMSDDARIQFIAVVLGLAIVLALTYLKFAKPVGAKPTKA